MFLSVLVTGHTNATPRAKLLKLALLTQRQGGVWTLQSLLFMPFGRSESHFNYVALSNKALLKKHISLAV